MVWKLPVSGPWRVAADYSLIIVGSMLVGVGVNLFLIPNQVVSGGVTGIAILMHFAFGTPVGLVTLILNLPLLAIGWKWAGGMKFLARTSVADPERVSGFVRQHFAASAKYQLSVALRFAPECRKISNETVDGHPVP